MGRSQHRVTSQQLQEVQAGDRKTRTLQLLQGFHQSIFKILKTSTHSSRSHFYSSHSAVYHIALSHCIVLHHLTCLTALGESVWGLFSLRFPSGMNKIFVFLKILSGVHQTWKDVFPHQSSQKSPSGKIPPRSLHHGATLAGAHLGKTCMPKLLLSQ